MLTAIGDLITLIAQTLGYQGGLLAADEIANNGSAATDIFAVLFAPWIEVSGDIMSKIATILGSL